MNFADKDCTNRSTVPASRRSINMTLSAKVGSFQKHSRQALLIRPVPLHGEISLDELSRACDMYEPDLRRILRFAIVHHRIFQEKRKNMISHSAASRRLVENSAARDAMGLMFCDSWQSFAKVCVQCPVKAMPAKCRCRLWRPCKDLGARSQRRRYESNFPIDVISL